MIAIVINITVYNKINLIFSTNLRGLHNAYILHMCVVIVDYVIIQLKIQK